MKPFFAYYGGKQRMAHNIIPLIPKHIVYCEPFAGGASILFLKSHPPTNNYIEVINDTNNLVYNFYKQLRDNPEELQRLINGTAYCEQTYKDTIDICKGKKQATNAIRAWAFFVNINTSFSNQLNTGWRRGIFSGNLSYYWYSRIKNLNNYLNRMQGVFISNVDALQCIRQWDSPQTFFYLDPPYVGSNQGHYGGYTQDDLNNLIELLQNIDGSFILSGYDNRSYPADWERFEFNVHCSASGKGLVGKDRDKNKKCSNLGDRKRVEIVLRHITHKPVRTEITKLYERPEFKCFCEN